MVHVYWLCHHVYAIIVQDLSDQINHRSTTPTGIEGLATTRSRAVYTGNGDNRWFLNCVDRVGPVQIRSPRNRSVRTRKSWYVFGSDVRPYLAIIDVYVDIYGDYFEFFTVGDSGKVSCVNVPNPEYQSRIGGQSTDLPLGNLLSGEPYSVGHFRRNCTINKIDGRVDTVCHPKLFVRIGLIYRFGWNNLFHRCTEAVFCMVPTKTWPSTGTRANFWNRNNPNQRFW